MSLRSHLADDLKTAMKAGDAARVSTVRMILARLKELDIAARPRGGGPVGDDELMAALRGMIKSRREAAVLYRQGGRAELAAKEEAEIALIEGYLPAQLDAAALATSVDAAISETGAAAMRDMGRVMALLKSRHGASLDLAQANGLVKARLSQSGSVVAACSEPDRAGGPG